MARRREHGTALPDADVEHARRRLGQAGRLLSVPPTDHEATVERLGRLGDECRAVAKRAGVDPVAQLDAVLAYLDGFAASPGKPGTVREWVERHIARVSGGEG